MLTQEGSAAGKNSPHGREVGAEVPVEAAEPKGLCPSSGQRLCGWCGLGLSEALQSLQILQKVAGQFCPDLGYNFRLLVLLKGCGLLQQKAET